MTILLMVSVPCYSDSEAERLLETLSFVQGKHDCSVRPLPLSGRDSKARLSSLIRDPLLSKEQEMGAHSKVEFG